MVRVWDYLMRRKGLLFLFLAFFVLGGIFSYQVLQSSAAEPVAEPMEYIHIDYLGQAAKSEQVASEIEIPNTGGEVTLPTILGILQPNEVVAIVPTPEELVEPTLPADTDENTQQTVDLVTEQVAEPTTTTVNEVATASKPSVGYLVFLSISGILVAILGAYLLEQHFMR